MEEKKFFTCPQILYLGSWKLNWQKTDKQEKVYLICIREGLKKWSEYPNEVVRLKNIYNILTKSNKFVEQWQNKTLPTNKSLIQMVSLVNSVNYLKKN